MAKVSLSGSANNRTPNKTLDEFYPYLKMRFGIVADYMDNMNFLLENKENNVHTRQYMFRRSMLFLLWRVVVIDVCCLFKERGTENLSLRTLGCSTQNWPVKADLDRAFRLRDQWMCHIDKSVAGGF